jgi:5'-3' exonuclease
MGIDGSWKAFREFSPDGFKPSKLEKHRGERWAIDGNALAYKFIYGNHKGSLYIQFGWLYVDLLLNKIETWFVFDGVTSHAKRFEAEDREKKKRKAENEIKDLQESVKAQKSSLGISPGKTVDKISPAKISQIDPKKFSELKEAEDKLMKKQKQSLRVTSQQIDSVMKLLRSMGARVIRAENDGEAMCSVLNRLGFVDAVVSHDSDVFAFGGKRLITGLSCKGKRDEDLALYDCPKILADMGLTNEKFIEVSILCGCDFTKNKISGIGMVRGLEYIKSHGTIEKVIKVIRKQKEEHDAKEVARVEKAKERNAKRKISTKIKPIKPFKHVIPDDFDPKEARSEFYKYLKQETVYPEVLALKSGPFNVEAVKQVFRDNDMVNFYNEIYTWENMLKGASKSKGLCPFPVEECAPDSIPDPDLSVVVPSSGKEEENVSITESFTESKEGEPMETDSITKKVGFLTGNDLDEMTVEERDSFEQVEENKTEQLEVEPTDNDINLIDDTIFKEDVIHEQKPVFPQRPLLMGLGLLYAANVLLEDD